MNAPAFLALTALPLPRPLEHAAGGGQNSGTLANFAIQPQTQSNWCWAAVSASVAQFYRGQTNWSQCTVANAELGRKDCCAGGASGGCNQTNTLNTALTTVGHLRNWSGGTVGFDVIKNEIGTGQPLGCRVGWANGGGHFVVISGWVEAANGTQYVHVYDPFYAFSQTTYQAFAGSYQAVGTWTHHYFTQPAAVAAGGKPAGATS
jgi:papain like cysteine protease AvrRpt2